MDYHISNATLTILAILAIWEIIWKGIALWRSAQARHQAWYIVILIINSAGVLPIVYLLTHREGRVVKKEA